MFEPTARDRAFIRRTEGDADINENGSPSVDPVPKSC
jgi:hypothetical protein